MEKPNSSIVETTVAPRRWQRVCWFATKEEAAAFADWVVDHVANVPKLRTGCRFVATTDDGMRALCPFQLEALLPDPYCIDTLCDLALAFVNGWTCGARSARQEAHAQLELVLAEARKAARGFGNAHG